MSETKQLKDQEMADTQPSPKKEVCRQLKSKDSIDILDDNFDIVESEPDSCGDEDDESGPSNPAANHCIPPAGPSRRKLSQSAQALLNAAEAEALGAMAASGCGGGGGGGGGTVDVQKLSEAALAKEKQILQTEVGFWDVMSCIDRGLITLFGKTLVCFYLAVVFFTAIHVTITYFMNKDLWFKYFPVDDDSNAPPHGSDRFMSNFDRQDL